MKSHKSAQSQKGKSRKTSDTVIFRLTRQRQEHINTLADSLAKIAPTTVYWEGSFSIETLARDWGLYKYFKKQRNKKNDLRLFLSNVFRYRVRTPKQLVIEIVKRGMQWKANQGETVGDELLGDIAKEMAALGFDIEKELTALERPAPSKLCLPGAVILRAFKALPFHQKVMQEDIINLFTSGQYNEAVRKCFERLEATVQGICTDLKSEYGKDLMSKAFSETNPRIKITLCRNQEEINTQQGIRFMAMGAMMSIRNPTSHGDKGQMNVGEAIELIGFASYLFKLVDKRIEDNSG
ncbi:MAG: TIGR02391 family protein [Sphaerochaeta sp.]|uniref:TIGR02391 family protein n=1 Tax=Sphaerochaeta sp. TaxID=1972642 RepID=UPI00258DC8F5|nr:TIGR02391 family protein [Sphaerochaeta sp.]MDD4039228.1 TIGR02391 family protein [Sphaerochaeta sp.]